MATRKEDSSPEGPNSNPNPFAVDMNNFRVLNQSHQKSISSNIGQKQDNQAKGTEESQLNQVIVKQDGEAGFFLTGVNVNQDTFIKPKPIVPRIPSELEGLELVTVVDSFRALSSEQCLIVTPADQQQKDQLIQLSCNGKQVLKCDRLISKYSQVESLSKSLVTEFLCHPKKHRVLVNLVDQANTNNIGGFNITNFKMRYLNEFITDVIADYEQSVIGSFCKNLFTQEQESHHNNYIVEMSITKFKGEVGYSLVQGGSDLLDEDNEDGQLKQQQQQNTKNEFLMAASMTPRQQEDEGSPGQRGSADKRRSSSIAMNNPTLPEFKKISEVAEIYSAFTQANLRFKILQKKEKERLLIQQAALQLSGNYRLLREVNQQLVQIDTEFKDDIIMMQFKLSNKETMKKVNTLSFLNVPVQKIQTDPNLSTIQEILIKIKQPMTLQPMTLPAHVKPMPGYSAQHQPNKPATAKKEQYLPYNKSIMTRILAPQLAKNNVLILHHMTRKSVFNILEQKGVNQPNLFLFIDKVFGEKRVTKKKLNEQEALKILHKKFPLEVKEIYSIIDNFREGLRSFEVFKNTQNSGAAYHSVQSLQTTISMGPQSKIQNPENGSTTKQFTMFHEVLHFLSMKEEIDAVSRGEPNPRSSSQNRLSSSFLPEEEIQKVIFDKQYLKYLERKLQGEEPGLPGLYIGLGTQQQEREKKSQLLQYESIKNELKDEYERKIGVLKSRLTQRSMKDPSFWLFNQMSSAQTGTITSENLKKPQSANSSFIRNQSSTSTSMIQGGRNHLSKERSTLLNSFPEGLKLNEKDRQFEFYLKSAQKAIDIMRNQQLKQMHLNMYSNSQLPNKSGTSFFQTENNSNNNITQTSFQRKLNHPRRNIDTRSASSHDAANSRTRQERSNDANSVINEYQNQDQQKPQLEMINEKRARLHTSNAVHRRKISSAHQSNNNSVPKSQRQSIAVNASVPKNTQQQQQQVPLSGPKILANLLGDTAKPSSKFFQPLRAQGKLNFPPAPDMQDPVGNVKENQINNNNQSILGGASTAVPTVMPFKQQRKPMTAQRVGRAELPKINNLTADGRRQ